MKISILVGSNPRSTTLEASTLTITPLMQLEMMHALFKQEPWPITVHTEWLIDNQGFILNTIEMK
jgi:hypothetical protein